MKLAEDTSDLQTESEIETEAPLKRKFKKTKRYISSDDNDDDDKHCRPPQLKKKIINKTVASTSTLSNHNILNYLESLVF